jgi:hypothetical protein
MPQQRRGLISERRDDPLRFAQCRSLGHEWRHRGTVTDGDTKRPFGALHGTVGLRSQCADCKTERVKWVTRSGEVHTRYEYPDGYSLHGEDRMSPQQWRSSFVQRVFDDVKPGRRMKSA